MNRKTPRALRRSRRARRGFTFIELMIASAIAVVVALQMTSLVMVTARDQQLGMMEQRVFERADQLQDRITGLLQGASREAGLFYDSPSNSFFRRIVFRDAIGAANEELRYDPNTKRLFYDPNINVAGNQEMVPDAGGLTSLEEVRFRSAMKSGGIPDSSVVLVTLRVSDRGRGRASWANPAIESNWITSTRTFAVNLRRK